jgi:hypothetical protein
VEHKEFVSRELSRCRLNLVREQVVRWDDSGTEPVGDYTFFYGNENENHELGISFLVHGRIISAVKRVQFVCNRTS